MVAKEGGNKPARGILYILSRLAIVVVAAAVVVVAFYAAMNTMNIRMVAKDALSLRAEVVLTHDEEKVDSSQLQNYFTERFLTGDPVLNSSTYSEFQITNYYQRADIRPPVIWPWQTEAKVPADDIITEISGHLAAQTEEDGEDTTKPPEWQSGTYELSMVKVDGVWMIDGMELVQAVMPEETSMTEETPAASE